MSFEPSDEIGILFSPFADRIQKPYTFVCSNNTAKL